MLVHIECEEGFVSDGDVETEIYYDGGDVETEIDCVGGESESGIAGKVDLGG